MCGELRAAPSPFRAHPPDHGGRALPLLGRLAREPGGVDAEGLRPLPDLVGFERGQRGFAVLDPFDGRCVNAGEPCEGLFEDAFPFPDRAQFRRADGDGPAAAAHLSPPR